MSGLGLLILEVIGTYLVVGLIALIVFNRLTGRIQRNMTRAATDTTYELAVRGLPVQPKQARIVILITTWLFWPAVFIGAMQPARRKVNGHHAVISKEDSRNG